MVQHAVDPDCHDAAAKEVVGNWSAVLNYTDVTPGAHQQQVFAACRCRGRGRRRRPRPPAAAADAATNAGGNGSDGGDRDDGGAPPPTFGTFQHWGRVGEAGHALLSPATTEAAAGAACAKPFLRVCRPPLGGDPARGAPGKVRADGGAADEVDEARRDALGAARFIASVRVVVVRQSALDEPTLQLMGLMFDEVRLSEGGGARGACPRGR